MKKLFKRSVALFAAIILAAGVFTTSAFAAAAQKNYGCKFGSVKTVLSDYKTECDSFTVNGDSGKIYLYFDAVEALSAKAKSNVFYGFALYSDAAYTNTVVNMSGAFPTADSTAVVPWNVTSFAGGKYYGIVYTWIKASDSSAIVDADSVVRFTVDVNKVGDAQPVLTSVTVTAAGNRFGWSSVENADFYRVYRKADGEASWSVLSNVAGTVYTDNAVSEGVNYTYTVKAFNGTYASKYDKNGVYAVYLTAPEVLAPETVENNGIRLSWNPVNGAGGYAVYKKNAEGTYDRIAKLGADVCEFTDFCGEVSGEAVYYYKVRAFSGITAGLVSAPVKAVVFGKIALSGAYCADGKANITWDKTDGADKYLIYKKEAGGEWVSVFETADAYSFTDTDIETGKKYSYSLQVLKNGRLSSFDAKGLDVTALGTATVNAVGNSVNNTVSVSWSKVAGAAGYRVYRRTQNGEFTYIGRTSKLKFYDTTEKSNNLRYYYCVEAFAANSLGEKSGNAASVIFMAAPDGLTVGAVSGGNQVKWNRVAGATAYKVYRKDPSGSWKLLANTGSALTFTDKTAAKGTAYYYTVAAMNGKITGSYNTGKGINCLDAPALTLAETQGTGYVKISWNAVAGAESYYVYVKTDTSSWVRLGSTKALYFTDKSAKTNDTDYTYTVRAYDGKHSADYEPVGKTVLYLSAPVSAVDYNLGGNTVSWQPVKGAEGYSVYRRPVGGSFVTLCRATTATSFTDVTAADGEYEYAVRAYCGSTRSGYITVK